MKGCKPGNCNTCRAGVVMYNSKELVKRIANSGLWLTLLALLVVTSVHAVTLVTGEAAIARAPGVVGWIFYGARVAFPVIVELCAVVVALGFTGRAWTGWQVWVGLAVEIVWLVFAALNMLTAFAVERGAVLAGWQTSWVAVGIPLSALVAGTLTYILKRVDPAELRALANAAASYFEDEMAFGITNAIKTGPQAQRVIEQRAWLDYIASLKLQGYSPTQIQFMLSHVPALSADADGNGRSDLLDAVSTPAPAPAPGRTFPVDLPGDPAPFPTMRPRPQVSPPPGPGNGVHRARLHPEQELEEQELR